MSARTLIDERDRDVRMLQVGSGADFSGSGRNGLILVDAITAIDDKVHIDTSHEQVTRSPEYDPELTYESEFYSSLYGNYGYTPFWVQATPSRPYPYLRAGVGGSVDG